MTVRLVALDIDGTLLAPGVPHSAVPDPEMTQAISNLVAAGVAVVLATGRMHPGTARIAKHLGLTSPLICQQGAATQGLDGHIIHQCSLDRTIAVEVATFAQKANWPYAWFDATRYLLTAPNPASDHFADVSDIVIEYHPQPEVSDVIASGIDIISTVDKSPEIHNHLVARYGNQVTLLDFPSVTAVHAAEASKGNALATIASDLDIDQADVLAVGDSVNDVSMLTWAGHGATPAHCDSYARSAADEILSGSGVDGVCGLLQSVARDQG